MSDLRTLLILQSNGRIRLGRLIHLLRLVIAALIVLAAIGLISTRPVHADERTEEELTNSPVILQVEADGAGPVLVAPSVLPSVAAETVSEPISEVWEVSTRHMPDSFRCINVANPGFEANRFTNCRWQRDDLEKIFVEDGRLPILYVHGNFMERNNALQRVLIVDQYLKRRACRPYRLIMLSWPSQKESKPLRDVYDNAQAAECQSLYFAWLLDRLSTQPQVSILGFSFGSRAVTGGLHFVSGGCVPGMSYTSVRPDGAAGSIYRVGLVAPAIDRNWLSPRGRNGLALQNVDSLINLYNSKDPVLRRFRFLDRLTRPIAAGFAGFVGVEGLSNPRATSPLNSSSKIRQYDCGSVIGTTHSERSYYGECPYFGMLLDSLLWKETSGSGTAP